MEAGKDATHCEKCGGEPVAVRVAGQSLCAVCARKDAEKRAEQVPPAETDQPD